MLTVEFLSTAGWLPENEANDTVSLLVNRHILVDTGWHCARNLLRAGVDPSAVDTLLLTHLHQDHYISLPSLLFYFFNGVHSAASLTICGPQGVSEIVEMAASFAGHDRYFPSVPLPRTEQLEPGGRLTLPDVTIEAVASRHAVPGLSYRFTDPQTGRRAVYSGDTAPFPGLVQFAEHADALIHECSWGARRDPNDENACRHSTSEEAALCALNARVGALYLVHCFEKNRGPALDAARSIFPNTFMPEVGVRLSL